METVEQLNHSLQLAYALIKKLDERISRLKVEVDNLRSDTVARYLEVKNKTKDLEYEIDRIIDSTGTPLRGYTGPC